MLGVKNNIGAFFMRFATAINLKIPKTYFKKKENKKNRKMYLGHYKV